LPEDEQTSKHGGGGRYDAILEFKRGANKKILMRKKGKYEKEKERKRNKEKNCRCFRPAYLPRWYPR
jgi:hypothetical protein